MNDLYFAYGSNLNAAQMKKRCPTSKKFSAAVLHGWKLTERLYADIEKDENECVNGALYFITEDDLESLDIYEGFPEVYGRELVIVSDNEGCLRRAWTYTVTEKYKNIRAHESYSEKYRQTCSEGAEHWGIPNAFAPVSKSTKNTLFSDKVPKISEGLDIMLDYLDSNSPLPRAKSLWQGADVIITLKKQNIQSDFYPAPFEVCTAHAEELSWVFNDLRDLFMGEKLLDCCSKDEFFGELAAHAAEQLTINPSVDARSLCRSTVLQAAEFYKFFTNV